MSEPQKVLENGAAFLKTARDEVAKREILLPRLTAEIERLKGRLAAKVEEREVAARELSHYARLFRGEDPYADDEKKAETPAEPPAEEQSAEAPQSE